jgi:hypothetical protein
VISHIFLNGRLDADQKPWTIGEIEAVYTPHIELPPPAPPAKARIRLIITLPKTAPQARLDNKQKRSLKCPLGYFQYPEQLIY